MNIIFVGASITQGFWDTGGGWVARITRTFMKRAVDTKTFYGAGSPPVAFNLGISGDNAERILGRLDTELAARVDGRGDVVVFSFGVNDSQARGGKFTSSPKKFLADLTRIFEITKNYVDNVFFANILPCDEKLVQPVAWNDSIYYYNDRIDDFNQVLEEFCRGGGSGLKVIDIATPFKKALEQRELLMDGLHPNDAGHELIAEVVLERLWEVIE
ncbi:GDSL-type esterase/lipase family protein [Candidatus Saccharibacteria bacterium]|nr:GDSL-type esterase/lipase family protein [Candidatus Saccharibacteria bacterium]